jgi:colanic acid biosynthesis glycosyl transferase WcaI
MPSSLAPSSGEASSGAQQEALLVISAHAADFVWRAGGAMALYARRGHQVTVYTALPNYPNGKIFDGYGVFGPYNETRNGAVIRRVPLIPRGGGGSIRLAFNYVSHAVMATVLAPFQAKGKFDAILVYEPSPMTIGIPARALRAFKRAPLLFWVQDLWPESLSATGAVRSRAVLALVDRLIKWI